MISPDTDLWGIGTSHRSNFGLISICNQYLEWDSWRQFGMARLGFGKLMSDLEHLAPS